MTTALVRVHFDIPYQLDGVACLKYVGAGLVVDAAIGLVLVDRNTIPVIPGDVRVEFASTVSVPAIVRFLHPTHNLAFVQYDPSTLTGEPVVSATLSPEALEVGQDCTFVGLSKIDAAALPVFQPCVVRESCIIDAGLPSIPRYRAVNEEIIRFDLGMALEDTVGGVFVDEEGHVKALWAAYATATHDEELYEQFEGMPIGAAIALRDALARGDGSVLNSPPPPWQQPLGSPAPGAAGKAADGEGDEGAVEGALHFLDAELRPVSLATACGIAEGSGLGLTREWAERLASTDTEKRQALLVQRLAAPMKPKRVAARQAADADADAVTAPASAAAAKAGEAGTAGKEGKEADAADAADAAALAGCLHEGDLLLAVDGVPVSTFRAVEECVRSQPATTLTLLRDGVERSIETRCSRVASDGTVHVVMWCGLVLQPAYRAVLERGFEPPQGGVYISYYLFGSPAHKHKLVPKHWVIEVNGAVVSGMRSFVGLIEKLHHGESCRVKTVDLAGRTSAYTVKTDHAYWRSYEVVRKDGKWVQRVLGEPKA